MPWFWLSPLLGALIVGVSVRKLSPAANERAVGDQWA